MPKIMLSGPRDLHPVSSILAVGFRKVISLCFHFLELKDGHGNGDFLLVDGRTKLIIAPSL